MEIYRGSLAGVQYHDYQLVKNLKVNTPLTLKHERNNPYDPNAIAVYAGEHKIGYIKAEHKDVFFNYRNRGVKVTAKIAAFNKTNPTWHMITIKVTVPTEAKKDDKF